MVSQKRVQIGLLHSQTGTMAISELPLLEAEMLAIDEINANGGVLRHKIEYIIEDGASDPEIFAKKAASLILKNNIRTVRRLEFTLTESGQTHRREAQCLVLVSDAV